MTKIAAYTCPGCGSNEFEKRGDQRVYFNLHQNFEPDGWNNGDISIDVFPEGEEIIYCMNCEAELRTEDLNAIAANKR